mgnify:CR=1 FL=1
MGHIYIKDIQFAAESNDRRWNSLCKQEAVEAVALEDRAH